MHLCSLRPLTKCPQFPLFKHISNKMETLNYALSQTALPHFVIYKFTRGTCLLGVGTALGRWVCRSVTSTGNLLESKAAGELRPVGSIWRTLSKVSSDNTRRRPHLSAGTSRDRVASSPRTLRSPVGRACPHLLVRSTSTSSTSNRVLHSWV